MVRSFVVAGPIIIILFQRLQKRIQKPWLPIALFLFTLALNPALGGVLDTRYAWGALNRKPNTDLLQFVNSPKFEPNKTYRIIRAGDGKIGMYQIVRKGGKPAVTLAGYVPNVDQTFGGYFGPSKKAPSRTVPACTKRKLPWQGKIRVVKNGVITNQVIK